MRASFPDRSVLWMLMGEVFFVSASVSQRFGSMVVVLDTHSGLSIVSTQPR